MISADVKAHVKQQDKNESFIRSTFKTWNVKLACIFHSILLRIPSSLILSITNRGEEVLRNGQNLLSVTKIICRWSLGTKQLIKTNKNINKKKLSIFVLIYGSITASAV